MTKTEQNIVILNATVAKLNAALKKNTKEEKDAMKMSKKEMNIATLKAQIKNINFSIRKVEVKPTPKTLEEMRASLNKIEKIVEKMSGKVALKKEKRETKKWTKDEVVAYVAAMRKANKIKQAYKFEEVGKNMYIVVK